MLSGCRGSLVFRRLRGRPGSVRGRLRFFSSRSSAVPSSHSPTPIPASGLRDISAVLIQVESAPARNASSTAFTRSSPSSRRHKSCTPDGIRSPSTGMATRPVGGRLC